MKDEVEKLAAKYITRESHKGSVNRIRYLLAEDVLALFQKAQVKAVRAELESIKLGWSEVYAGDRIATALLQIDLDERLANLKEDGETK